MMAEWWHTHLHTILHNSYLTIDFDYKDGNKLKAVKAVKIKGRVKRSSTLVACRLLQCGWSFGRTSSLSHAIVRLSFFL